MAFIPDELQERVLEIVFQDLKKDQEEWNNYLYGEWKKSEGIMGMSDKTASPGLQTEIYTWENIKLFGWTFKEWAFILENFPKEPTDTIANFASIRKKCKYEQLLFPDNIDIYSLSSTAINKAANLFMALIDKAPNVIPITIESLPTTETFSITTKSPNKTKVSKKQKKIDFTPGFRKLRF